MIVGTALSGMKSAPQSLDIFPAELSYGQQLLIGCDGVALDNGAQMSAFGNVGAPGGGDNFLRHKVERSSTSELRR